MLGRTKIVDLLAMRLLLEAVSISMIKKLKGCIYGKKRTEQAADMSVGVFSLGS